MGLAAIPILRIFDEDRAREFYLEFLGFHLDWEHRFEAAAPLYMQVSRDGMRLHLTQHHGDCTPGAKVFVETDRIDELQRELAGKPNRNNRPGIQEAPWGDRILEVIDPFANRLLFNETGRGADGG